MFHASLSQTLREDNILQHEVHDHPYFFNSKIQATLVKSQLSKILKEQKIFFLLLSFHSVLHNNCDKKHQ
jgi:hypothetical protein